ncbi:MAG: hypothetical protein IJJ33_15425 [Victivallales bacterium]|nr:hypothetical protein [Victivallales bacterium]
MATTIRVIRLQFLVTLLPLLFLFAKNCFSDALLDSKTLMTGLLDSKTTGEALRLIEQWKIQPPPDVSHADLLLWEGHVRFLKGEYPVAIANLKQLVTTTEELPLPLLAKANALLGQSQLLVNDWAGAEESWQAEAEIKLKQKRQSLRQAGRPVYFVNRVDLDGPAEELHAILERVSKDSDGLTMDIDLKTSLRKLAMEEIFPGMRGLASRTAARLLTAGKHSKATALCLRALSTGEDRCFQRRAKLLENQRQLNLVALPIQPKECSQLFQTLGLAIAERNPDAVLDNLRAETMAERYCQALAPSWTPQGGSGDALERLAETQTCQFWKEMLLQEAALAYFREGRFAKGLTCLALHHPCPELEQRRAYLRGLLLMGEGSFSKAISDLEQAGRQTGEYVDVALASKALLLLGDANEAIGALTRASAARQMLLTTSPVQSHRREAQCACQRIWELKDIPWHEEREEILQPLKEDRMTHGDWPMRFGRQYQLLAAQQGKTDHVGYSHPDFDLHCRFQTTDPKEKSRLWVTRRNSPDPAALWNPHLRTRTTANRDDYGEQYPIGNGPHLVMECDIPDGHHVLSLYFANDSFYYESNRAYTVCILEKGRLLASVPLRWFGAGIYKRFAVRGPRHLTVQIRRNASMNVLLCGVFLDTCEGMFNQQELEILCTLFPECTRERPWERDLLSASDVFELEKQAQTWAENQTLQHSSGLLDSLLQADAWTWAGHSAIAIRFLDKSLDMMNANFSISNTDKLLFFLANLNYWETGGSRELWQNATVHPLTRIWSLWLDCRERQCQERRLSPDSHWKEMAKILSSPKWNIPSATRETFLEKIPSDFLPKNKSIEVLYALACQYEKEHLFQKRTETLTKIQRMLENTPEHPMYSFILLEKAGDRHTELMEAEKCCEQLMRTNGVEQRCHAGICLMLSDRCQEKGIWDRAMAWLEKASRLGCSIDILSGRKKAQESHISPPKVNSLPGRPASRAVP